MIEYFGWNFVSRLDGGERYSRGESSSIVREERVEVAILSRRDRVRELRRTGMGMGDVSQTVSR